MLYMSTNYTGGLINGRGHQNDDPHQFECAHFWTYEGKSDFQSYLYSK